MLRMLALALYLLPAEPSAGLAAIAVGRPDIGDDLRRICRRESRCRRLGVHTIDSHLDGWAGQVRLGHLDPKCQPWAPRTWTTRGAFGLSAASNWPYLPPCYQPEWLDVPIVSAVAAALRYLDRCDEKRTSGWCPAGKV